MFHGHVPLLTFDRVWHDGSLFKLKQNGVSGNLFQLIASFSSRRFQRILLLTHFTHYTYISITYQTI